MNSIEFGKACRPYLKQYYKEFGEAPSPSDFACSNEDFLKALVFSVEQKKRITEFLMPIESPKDSKQ